MSSMTPRTIRDAIDTADAARFIGRDAELISARDLIDDTTPSRVLYVHGPAGIGKSAFLRAVGRLAKASGFAVLTIDTQCGSRDIQRQVDAIEAECEPRTLVVIDDLDLLGSKVATMRDRLFDVLNDSNRVVVASRNPPDPSWRHGGLDVVVADVGLRELTIESAHELLAMHGVAPERVAELVTWAHGSPLALTIGALSSETVSGQSDVTELEERVTVWLSGRSSLDVATEFLEVAALAPRFDARLLAAALPARTTRNAMAELVALPVVQPFGDRASLHRVLAAAIRARLIELSPERYRVLSRRIVEHLGDRARLGDISALVEMSEFIDDPTLQMAVSNRPSPSLFTDRPSEGELTRFAEVNGFDRGVDWNEVAAYVGAAPYRLVVRDSLGNIVLYGAFARVDLSERIGVVTESLLDVAHAGGTDPSRSMIGMVMFGDAPSWMVAESARLGTGALMHRHGIPNMLATYIHYPEPDRRPDEIVSILAKRATSDVAREVMVSDFGPDGAVGFVESIVLGGLGFPSRLSRNADLLLVNEDPQRIADLRARLDVVFDSSTRDQRLRRVIEVAHLGPKRSVEECLQLLHVSRRTWFRLLREARERVIGMD